MKALKPLTLVYLEWAKQAATDRRKWAEMKQQATPKELDAFEIGVREGFLDAVNTLKLHGHAVGA